MTEQNLKPEHDLNPEHDRVAAEARDRIHDRIAVRASGEAVAPPEGAFEDDIIS
jgi:hypothetical protein